MGFKTRRLSIADIELVRYWRNKDFVKNQMLTIESISSKNQKDWFSKLDKDRNHFFIYSLNDIDIGCVSCKINDSENKVFDIGVYCGNSSFLGHPVNFMSIIFIHDFAFFEMKLLESLTLIKNTNISSLNINKKIGYSYHNTFNSKFDYYNLTRRNYVVQRKKLEELINKIKF